MEETIRLFDQDAYATSFTSEVLSCKEREEGGFWTVLKETLFFPEAGGQSCDTGRLNQTLVKEVKIEQGIIYHLTEEALASGEVVYGEIDWEHRFSHMQQHSGEHIFSGTVKRLFGLNNVGFHLSDQTVTMDYDGILSMEQLETVEWEVNRAITENILLEVSYPAKEELAQIDYRSKLELEGAIRIVDIPGYDCCACCAPHVRRTGEIGMVKVMSVQHHKGGMRINILCGFRALSAFREKNRIISALTSLLSTHQEAIPVQVEKQKDKLYMLKGELAEAKQKLLTYKIGEIAEQERNVLLFEQGLSEMAMRYATNLLVERHLGVCGVFCEKEDGGYRYILGSREINCKEIGVLLQQKFGAKGGGSEAMIQGFTYASRKELEDILTTI